MHMWICLCVRVKEHELKPRTGSLFNQFQGRLIFYVQETRVLLKPLSISVVSLVLSVPVTQPWKFQLEAQGYFGVEIIRFWMLASHSGPLKYIRKHKGISHQEVNVNNMMKTKDELTLVLDLVSSFSPSSPSAGSLFKAE